MNADFPSAFIRIGTPGYMRKLFFSFDGRINRARFWLVVIAAIVLLQVIPAAVIFGLMLMTRVGSSSVVNVLTGVLAFYGIYAALLIVYVWVTTAAAVKRLHDRGKTGWWVALLGIGSQVLFVSGLLLPRDMGPVVLGASLMLAVWGFVELGCLPGTAGPNAYGPDPLAEASTTAGTPPAL